MVFVIAAHYLIL